MTPQVFDVKNSSKPIFAYFTPGSMFDVAITETASLGVVVVGAGKHVHANIFVRSYEFLCDDLG